MLDMSQTDEQRLMHYINVYDRSRCLTYCCTGEDRTPTAIQKNQKRERLAKKYASKRARLKAIAKDESQSTEERFNARLKLAELPRNSSPTRIRLRCGLSGRPRGNYRKFKLSRIALRDLASTGQIPGMVKSSW